MDSYRVLVFYLLEAFVLYHQLRTIKRIRIKETYSQSVKLTYYVIGLGFLAFGLFISQTLSQLGLFFGLGAIFFLAPQTTGLADHAYYYRGKLGGFAGLMTQEQTYTEVLNCQITRQTDALVVVFTHNSYRNELAFSLADQEAVEQLLTLK